MRYYTPNEEFVWNEKRYKVEVGDCEKCALYDDVLCHALRKTDEKFPDCDPDTRSDKQDVIFIEIDDCMRHMNDTENVIFDEAVDSFLSNAEYVHVLTEDELQSLIRKSNGFDRILKHLGMNDSLNKKFIEIRDKALEDNCQSTVVHLCLLIDYLYENFEN